MNLGGAGDTSPFLAAAQPLRWAAVHFAGRARIFSVIISGDVQERFAVPTAVLAPGGHVGRARSAPGA